MGMATFFVPVAAQQLEELRRDPDAVEDALFADEDSDAEGTFDVDKAWHGLHYLLTGTSDGGEAPLSWAIFGDEELGADLGMGGSSFLTPAQVREVAAALAGLTEEELRRRFDPAQMQALNIYPDVIWTRDGKDALDYVMAHFEPLVRFYADTAGRGDGIITYMG